MEISLVEMALCAVAESGLLLLTAGKPMVAARCNGAAASQAIVRQVRRLRTSVSVDLGSAA